jgi:hypothetical protein
MTLNEIKGAIAAYLNKETEDLTVNSVDLGLMAMNQVRQQAELNNNFEFARKLVTVTVDGVTGGSLENAVLFGTSATVKVKGVVDVGVFDDEGNLRGVEWTTVGDSLNIARSDNERTAVPRHPTDGEALSTLNGTSRITFSGSQIMVFPYARGNSYTLGVEAYVFANDWTENDVIAASQTIGSPWNTQGSQFLLFGSIVHLNNLYKEFVFRQEGNLPPPKDLRDEALASLLSWDIFRYAQSRRHDRR